MAKRIRILLAEDHALVREGVRRLFNEQEDMEVVAEAEDGLEALRLAEIHAPAIAVVDISMPGLDGIQVAQRMTESSPHVRIIALTRHTDGNFVRRMLDAGARGYVLKQSAGTELTRAVRAVAAGDQYIDGSVRGINVGNAAVQPHGNVSRLNVALTPNEEEVLRLTALAHTNGMIAGLMSKDVTEVSAWKTSAMAKAGLRTRGDVVRYAESRGWLGRRGDPT